MRYFSSLFFTCHSLLLLNPIFLSSELPLKNYPYFKFSHPIEALALAQPYLPNNPIIIDAGCFDGIDSLAMAKKWPQGHIHAFEPLTDTFQLLLSNVSHCANITPYPYALSDQNGTALMYVSEMAAQQGVSSQSSSLLAPKEHITYAPHVIFPKQIQVPTFTLDQWAQEYHISHVDLLWLDMQGLELTVLKAAPQLLKTVKVILTEVEFVEAYEGQSLYPELKQWLEEQGFELIGSNFNLAHPTKRGMWFGDALFVKRSLLP